jgi:pimeloyl-ACP methyl ester carboxylesterase
MGGAWNGPDTYSWTKYANAAGFGTLAVDNLGNGLSDHPDPAQVQLTLMVEILNILAKMIKNGKITGTPSKIVYVGHSLGSILGTMLVAKYPSVIDKLVLTGYTTDLSNVDAGVLAGKYEPAKDVDPARFGTLPQGYVTQSVEPGRTFFYAGCYDPTIPPLDFLTKGTFAIGEPLFSDIVPVPDYEGPVFILTGAKDKSLCGADPSIPCERIIQASASEFPKARSFGYFMPPDTGHCLNFHCGAQASFEAVTNWLLHDSNNHD